MKKLVYSPGEPSGIGIDLIIKLSNSNQWEALNIPVLTLSDPTLLNERAKLIDQKIKIENIENIENINLNKKGIIQNLAVSRCKNTTPGKLYKANANYVLKILDYGIKLAEESSKTGLVTGPISKENIIKIDKNFTGHTERIQELTESKDVLMLLASKKLRVALVTTHIPLSAVPNLIDEKIIIDKAIILHSELKNKFKIKNPRITMLGLNPHAGEGGKIGTEDAEILLPAAKKLRKIGIDISSPVSADTAFTGDLLKKTDAYLAMYHDQALPVLKALSFGKAINITLGVPIIRTSVDHGVALDVAGKDGSNFSSLLEAFKAAKKLIK